MGEIHMMRLTFLMLFGNAIFYLIQAVSCCRILTRRFSWPVMVLGFAVGVFPVDVHPADEPL